MDVDSKGYFCSILSVIIALTVLLFLSAAIRSHNKLSDAVASAIELEQVDFKRFQVEENITKVVKETIQEELAKGNTDSVVLNAKINENIKKALNYFRDYFGCKLYITDGFTHSKFYNTGSLSSTIVIKGGKGYYVEYVFTGGLLKNKRIACEVDNGAIAVASIVPGYTVRGVYIE